MVSLVGPWPKFAAVQHISVREGGAGAGPHSEVVRLWTMNCRGADLPETVAAPPPFLGPPHFISLGGLRCLLPWLKPVAFRRGVVAVGISALDSEHFAADNDFHSNQRAIEIHLVTAAIPAADTGMGNDGSCGSAMAVRRFDG